jgi:hypothetical protein
MTYEKEIRDLKSKILFLLLFHKCSLKVFAVLKWIRYFYSQKKLNHINCLFRILNIQVFLQIIQKEKEKENRFRLSFEC